MKRRDFGISALTGTAAIVTLPRLAKAAPPDVWTNVVYTAENPAHWKGREASHVPVVEIKDGKVTVRTPHGMSEEHYIVSHAVVLDNGVFLDRKAFTPKDQPVSEHTLPAGYSGSVTVASTCNLHDIWVKTVKV